MIPSQERTSGAPQNAQNPTTSSHQMIGPTSTFYDPESISQQVQDVQAQQYQQWIDSYDHQQEQRQQVAYSSQQQHQHVGQPVMSYGNIYSPDGDVGYRSYSYNFPAQSHSYPNHHHQQQQQQQQQNYDLGGPQRYANRIAENSLTIHTSGSSHSPTSPSHTHWLQHGPPSAATPTTTMATTTAPTTTRRPTPASKSTAPKRRPATSASVPPAKTAGKRKRTRRTPEGDDDSDSDDDDLFEGGISVGMGGMGVRSSGANALRPPGACTHCKKLKMKCDFPDNDNTCKRCKSGGHVCIVEGRKPRTAPNKREYLLAQIRQKDAIIESLLKQLHNPYIATPLSIASYRMATSPSDQNNQNVMDWLQRLQASVQNAGANSGTKAFKLDSRVDNTESEQEDDGLTHAQRFGLVPDDESGDDEDTDEDTELQSALPDSNVPLGLIANLSLSNSTKKQGRKEGKEDPLDEGDLDDDNVGVANETYFMPGPATNLDIRAMLIEQHSPPEILVHGLVTPDDVDRLFEIFYDRVNPFISLLDPVLHTPSSTFARCPFLFTVVCAISSRYYPEKSEIYPIAMHFAKHAAANALIDGWKSVELCQAYILMSIYAVPARRWEEDRSWLYTGLAIRIATDLNLHHAGSSKFQTEKQERESLNRTRVWMICFNLDRSTATQFGKPSTIKEDYVMRNSQEWYKKSKYNLIYDVHLCGYTALLRIVAKFHDAVFSDPETATGLNKRVDFRTVTMSHDAHLELYQEEWGRRFRQTAEGHDEDRTANFRQLLLPFLVAYSRLVMFSFGFQQAYQRGTIESGDNIFFAKCLSSAKTVIRCMIEDLAPSGYMRFAPDGHFIFATFASAFLLKLLRPEFSNILTKEAESEIFDLIGRLIQTLSSSSIAIDDRHTPKLYARFLAGLLSRHRRDGATVGRLHTQPPPTHQNQLSASSSSYGQSQSSMSTFTVSGHMTHTQDMQDMQNQQQHHPQHGYTSATPIYRPEATYAVGAGQIQFGGDLDMLNFEGNIVSSDDEMLATMQALKNPAWWDNMMMPGFSWPDASSPPSDKSSPGYMPAHGAPMNSGFDLFHATQQIPLR